MVDDENGKEGSGSVEPPGLDTPQIVPPLLGQPAEADPKGAIDEELVPSEGTIAPITEHYYPGPPYKLKTRQGTTDDSVRKWLAIALTGLLIALALLAGAGWMWKCKSLEDIQSFLLVMSPIVTLTGTILGFYFSSGKSDSSDAGR